MKTILWTLYTLLTATSLLGCGIEKAKDSTTTFSDSESVYDTAATSESDAVTISDAILPEPSADPSETDTAEGDLEATPGDALSKSTTKSFYISNPTASGKSNMLRLTPTCSTGATPSTPTISAKISGAYTYKKSSSRYYLSYSCQNIGTATVSVKCSSGTPALSYWFYDC